MTSPLTNSTFSRLFAAQVIALMGTGFTSIALALLAYDLAGGNAGAVLGSVLALKMVAYVGIAPFAGAIGQIIPRRTLLILLDIFRAGFVLCLPFVDAVWHVYVLIFLLNACSAVFTPTFQATIPDILPAEGQYTRALSYSRLAYDLENLLSPSLVAFAMTFLLGYDMLFVANSAAFIMSALLVATTILPSRKPADGSESKWRQLTFGLRAYLQTPRLRGLMALNMAVAMGGAMLIVNTVIIVGDDLFGSDQDIVTAYIASGCGSMIAALLLPRLLDRWPDRPFMLLGGATVTVGLGLGLAVDSFIMLLPVWFILGVGTSLIQTPAGRLLARSAHDSDRPSLYAAQFTLSHACWLAGYLAAGLLGASIGTAYTFVILAVLTAASTVLAFAIWPAKDDLSLDHEHEAMDHEHLHTHDEHHQHDHEGWEGPEPHRHPHRHNPVRHKHRFVIDQHHRIWPART